ncbi:hypothetical protein [Streptomyces sp. wa22]|uniref:hypothetical protein n=1 Tax=Streptomyces sp. wa22 TaxID=1828244 RepID=UPI0011C97CA9|nr:hypothetical protein [Streptomyces sp. wa22]TXS13228.1 hypothetical protein EAO68_18960 [Streptomyces sp. wa22]
MAAMTRASARTDRRRSGNGLLTAPVWALMLLAVFLCCSPAATAAPGAEAPSAVTLRAFTPVHAAAVSVVVADAPDERGIGSSCHGPVDHSTAVVLPGHPAPPAQPCHSASLRTAPLTGAAAIRGPSNDSVGSVDQLRLQIRRT